MKIGQTRCRRPSRSWHCTFWIAMAVFVLGADVPCRAQVGEITPQALDKWDDQQGLRWLNAIERIWNDDGQEACALTSGADRVAALSGRLEELRKGHHSGIELAAFHDELRDVCSRARSELDTPEYWLKQSMPLAVITGKRFGKVAAGFVAVDFVGEAIDIIEQHPEAASDLYLYREFYPPLTVSLLPNDVNKKVANKHIAWRLQDIETSLQKSADRAKQRKVQFDPVKARIPMDRGLWRLYAAAGRDEDAKRVLAPSDKPTWDDYFQAAAAAPCNDRSRVSALLQKALDFDAALTHEQVHYNYAVNRWKTHDPDEIRWRGNQDKEKFCRDYAKKEATRSTPMAMARIAYSRGFVLGIAAASEVDRDLERAAAALPAAERLGFSNLIHEYHRWSSSAYIIRIKQELGRGDKAAAKALLDKMGTDQDRVLLDGGVQLERRAYRGHAEALMFFWLLRQEGAAAANAFLVAPSSGLLWPQWDELTYGRVVEMLAVLHEYELSAKMLKEAQRLIDADIQDRFRTPDAKTSSTDRINARKARLSQSAVRAGIDQPDSNTQNKSDAVRSAAADIPVALARRGHWAAFNRHVSGMDATGRLAVYLDLVEDGLWRAQR